MKIHRLGLIDVRWMVLCWLGLVCEVWALARDSEQTIRLFRNLGAVSLLFGN